MNTNDPLKTSEGFALVCVLNFKFSKIFLSAPELRVLALRGPKPPAKVEKTQSISDRFISDRGTYVFVIVR